MGAVTEIRFLIKSKEIVKWTVKFALTNSFPNRQKTRSINVELTPLSPNRPKPACS